MFCLNLFLVKLLNKMLLGRYWKSLLMLRVCMIKYILMLSVKPHSVDPLVRQYMLLWSHRPSTTPTARCFPSIFWLKTVLKIWYTLWSQLTQKLKRTLLAALSLLVIGQECGQCFYWYMTVEVPIFYKNDLALKNLRTKLYAAHQT